MKFWRSGRLIVATALITLACIAAAWFFAPPVPPSPQNLSQFDPLVATAIRRPLWEARLMRFDADRWLKLGMVYEANDVFDLAARCYEYVVKRRPDDPRAWYRLACAFERSGDATNALTHLDKAIELEDKFAPLHWRRGWWLLELGRREQARAAFEQAQRINREEVAAQAGLASCMLQEGQTDTAIEVLERLSRRTNDPRVRRILGNAYLQAGRRDDAVAQFHRAGEADGYWMDRWSMDMAVHTTSLISVLMTVSDLSESDPAAAKAILEPLRDVYPNNCDLYCHLGKVNGLLGSMDEAQACFEIALQTDPNSGIAYAGLSAISHAQRDIARGLELIDRAIECNPRAGFMRVQRAKLLSERLRVREAIEEFERAFELDPTDVNALVLKGRLQSQLGDWQAAGESYRRAIEANPTFAAAHVGLGQVHIEHGRLDEAEQSLRTAASLNDTEAGLREALRELEKRRAIRVGGSQT